MSLTSSFSLVYGLAAAVALVAAAVVWPRRTAPGGAPLVPMLLATALWALCDAIELHAATVERKLLVAQIQYIGIVATAPCFFHVAMALSGRSARLGPRLLLAVWAVPLASLPIVWTNSWHNWIWTDVLLPSGALPFTIYEYGWWFWVLVTQNYLLMVAATILLLGAIRRVGRPFRAPISTVIVVAILPWIGNAAYNTKVGPWPGIDWLPLSLVISGTLLVLLVLREGLLDLLPQAREALLDRMADGVLVLDYEGRVTIANDAARAFALGGPELASALGVSSLRDAPEQLHAEAQIKNGETLRWLDVRVDPIRDRWGALAGRLVVARDVTFQKELEDERERLIDELQDALHKVVQLEGLLPICASCRKIRDDGGYWGHVEEYFGSRAPVEFTHGICPDCQVKLYPSIM
jgi:PAS domain-containing protein